MREVALYLDRKLAGYARAERDAMEQSRRG
jgi:hypothetical protein